jgi:hypothetical protein
MTFYKENYEFKFFLERYLREQYRIDINLPDELYKTKNYFKWEDTSPRGLGWYTALWYFNDTYIGKQIGGVKSIDDRIKYTKEGKKLINDYLKPYLKDLFNDFN